MYDSLGLSKEGDGFFRQAVIDGRKAVHPDDLPRYLRRFTKENVMREIAETGVFKLEYRLMILGEPRPVSLKIAPIKEGTEEKLFAGVRGWKDGDGDRR